MHRLLTFGPRIGFALLLAVLVGFELLFVSEAQAGAAALEAERSLREERAEQTLHEELLGVLDVAEARLEALETLPLVEEDGLLLVRDGVQLFPRLPGAAGQAKLTAKDEAATFRAMDSIWPQFTESTRRDILNLLLLGEPELAASDDRRRTPEGGSSEPIKTASDDRRRTPEGGSSEPIKTVQSVAWSSPLEEFLRNRSIHPALRLGVLRSMLDRAPPAIAGEEAQNLVLSAWPWLKKNTAARSCVDVQRRGDDLGLKTERFAAACRRGLVAQTVAVVAQPRPRLEGGWIMVLRDGEVRGVQAELPRQLEDLKKTLLKRGMLETGEEVKPLPAPRGERLVGLQLVSPRLDAAHAALRFAMWWKTVLLLLTALLGLGVVWLARLAERRKEETLALQREFIATVSHELRTPLAGIRLLAETLERKLGGESAAKDYPRRLVVAADGLGFLVENILSFNRLESGRWVPRREPFSFSSLQPLLEEDATLATDATVQVKCEGLDRMAAHQLDAQLIRVLAQNLLRNAWKYGRRQPVEFTVSGEDQGNVAVVRFKDNGPGIPLAERERVFEAFHRLAAEEGRTVGGSGLGLALARRIAALHGGTLVISESSEAGTTFELRLPRA